MASKAKMQNYDQYVENQRPANDMMVYRKQLSCAALCTKRSLLALNVLLFIFSIIIIAIGAYVVQSSIADLTTKGVPSGIIVLGVFLLILSVLGCIAAGKESKKLLGAYAIALFVILLIQIILSIVLLTQQKEAESWVTDGWNNASPSTQNDIMRTYSCCGLNNVTDVKPGASCPDVALPPCLTKLKNEFNDKIVPLGAVTITFGVIQLLSVLIALCLRVGVGDVAKTGTDTRTASRY